MTTPRQVLVAARKLIQDEDRWCQGKMRVEYVNGQVIQRCLVEAIDVSAGSAFDLMIRASAIMSSVVRNKHLARWNDEHTHEQVIRGLDKAIEKAAKWRRSSKS